VATRAQRRQATQNRIKAMSHQLRAEAFRLIRDKGPLSPRAIARELGADTKDVSYHIRKLKEFACVEEVSTRRVRGAVQTFYRATDEHMIDTEEWEELVENDPEMAEVLTDDFMQCILDDYTASRKASIVGLDKEFYIVRTSRILDSKGILESLEASERYVQEVASITARSAERQGREGTEGIPVSASVVLFKMPKPSAKEPTE
jgi:hypothetical protein